MIVIGQKLSNPKLTQSWLMRAPNHSVRFSSLTVSASALIRPWNVEYAPQSKFRAAVHVKDEQLKNAIISYLGTASDFTEADFTLVFSPAITLPKHEERPTRFMGEFIQCGTGFLYGDLMTLPYSYSAQYR